MTKWHAPAFPLQYSSTCLTVFVWRSRMEESDGVPGSPATCNVVFAPQSASSRLLVLAALAQGSTVLEKISDSDDVQFVLNALALLGVEFQEDFLPHCVTVVGCGGNLACGQRETCQEVVVFLASADGALEPLAAAVAAAGGNARVVLDGDPRLRERSIGGLMEGLQQLGANIGCAPETDCPPVVVNAAKGIRGGLVRLAGRVSSLTVTSLLIAAPLAKGDVEIQISGEVDLESDVGAFVKLMESFGVAVSCHGGLQRFSIKGGQTYRSPGHVHLRPSSLSAYLFLLKSSDYRADISERQGLIVSSGDHPVKEVAVSGGADHDKGVLQTNALHRYVLESTVYPREHEQLRALREMTARHSWHMSATPPDVGQFLMMLLRMTNARKCLEIGVYTGYSLLCIALALPPDGKVFGLDYNKEWFELGLPYLKAAGVAHKVEFLPGCASDTIDDLLSEGGHAKSFDFVYVDADKSEYLNYHEQALKLSKDGGVVVYSGTGRDHLLQFNESVVTDDPRVDVSMLALNEGITVCLKTPQL